jgi:hypothetical protein
MDQLNVFIQMLEQTNMFHTVYPVTDNQGKVQYVEVWVQDTCYTFSPDGTCTSIRVQY